jgi:hypothetical protein
MKCGHSATGTDSENKPVCVSCIGIIPGARDIADNPPDLTGRTAFCTYGKHAEVPSDYGLAFFHYCPKSDHDEYYCGCFGWD